MPVSLSQLNQAQLAIFIQQTASGDAFSGNMLAYVLNGGFLGNGVVSVTGDQSITGVKLFRDSPAVPYFGGTGRAPSARWVNDQITTASGGLVVQIAAANSILAANLATTGTNLYTLIVNGSGALTGQIGGGGGGSVVNVVYKTGNQSITGIKSFVNSPQVPDVLYTGPGSSSSSTISLNDLTAVSGVLAVGGGGGSPNSVTTTGNEIIGGFKQFTGSPFVPAPTQPSGAANLLWVSGASGVLTARDLAISGVLQLGINNASSTTIITGTQVYNLSGITGNFVNMSFYFDEFSLATGLNQVEAFVGRDFFFTGYAIGAINSGTQGSFSGSFYQRNQVNAKTTFVSFGMPPGQFFSGRGGFVQIVSGLNRVGLDIYSIGTGLTGLSLGLFGVGY